MSCIVYQTDKRTGIKYAYESISYWDRDKKQPRSKRKYLGKVDPVSGEILTSRSRKRGITGSSQEESSVCGPDIMQLQKELLEKDAQIETLRKEIQTLATRCGKAEALISRIASLTGSFVPEKTDV